jgi:hypothetical protein
MHDLRPQQRVQDLNMDLDDFRTASAENAFLPDLGIQVETWATDSAEF